MSKGYVASARREVPLLAVAALLVLGALPLRAQHTTIAGTVKDVAGEPVAGALVKVSNQEHGVGFMVVSQAQGRYSTPNLFPGKYTLQAFGGTHQAPTVGPVEVGKDQQVKVDLMLSAPLHIPPRLKRLTDEDYAKLLPDGEAKRVVAGKCGFCHSLLPVLSARKTRAKWQETVDRMYDNLLGIHRPLQSLGDEQREYDVVTPDYLAKHFGPDQPQDPRIVEQWFLDRESPSHPNRNLPARLLEGQAAKYVAMEFSLPAGSAPRDLALDSQGGVWVAEQNTGMFGRFDQTSMAYARFSAPPGRDPKVRLSAITVAPGDDVWLADDGPNGRLLRYHSNHDAEISQHVTSPGSLR